MVNFKLKRVIKIKKTTGIIIGAVLIIYGITFALSAFGIADINISFRGWWTLFIIIPCFFGILKGSEKIFSAAGLLVGLILLLSAQEIITYEVAGKLFVPIILIALGTKLIAKSVKPDHIEINIDDNGEKQENK